MNRTAVRVSQALAVITVLGAASFGANRAAPAEGRDHLAVSAVTASSSAGPSQAAGHVIDGSGLSASAADAAKLVHQSDPYKFKGVERGTMWSSGKDDRSPVVTFDLGKPHEVGSLRVWNYNEAGDWTGRGMKAVEFSSSDDGTTYRPQGSTRLERVSGGNDYDGQLISFRVPLRARYVRMRGLSNHGGDSFGLSEVRFYAGGAGGAGALTPDTAPPAAAPPPPPPAAQRSIANRPNPPRPAVPGAEDIVFPPRAGVIDVTAAPYGAKGDGQADDTSAIQRAIDDALNKYGVVYFPNGTYRVTRKLTYGNRKSQARLVVLQGQSEAGTIIRLADRAPGYGDAGRRNYLLTMFEGPGTGEAFNNAIHNMTFDVGAGNPGAVGVQWMSNNTGCLRHVTIRSGDPAGLGAVGLDLTRTEPGPSLAKHLTITGFDYAIDAVPGPFSMTFEYLSLRDQRVAGIRNKWHTFTIRGLRSANRVPALVQTDPSGMTVMLDSVLTGGDASRAAIENKGLLVLRDVRQEGYGKLLDNGGRGDIAGASVAEYASHAPKGAAPGAAPGTIGSLRLEVKETPDVPWDAPADWVVVDPDELLAVDDDTATIQAAFDRAAREGKTTVCLPGGLVEGTVRIGDTVRVRGPVRRVIGMDGPLTVADALLTADKPMFRVEGENIPGGAIVFERFSVVNWKHGARFTWIEHLSPAALVLRDVASLSSWDRGGRPYKPGPACGDLFLENSASAEYVIRKGQRCWMRQFNPETNRTGITNAGGDLWILGLKTETGGATVIETTGGGRTELLGGQNYSSWEPLSPKQPMFVVDGHSSASFTIGGISFDPARAYDVVLRRTMDGRSVDLSAAEADCGARGHARSFLLLRAPAAR